MLLSYIKEVTEMTTRTAKIERLMEEYSSQFIKFEEKNEIEFSDYSKWIEFIAVYFTRQYKDHLEYWKATAVDDKDEYRYWERKIATELETMYCVFKSVIEEQYNLCSVKKQSWLSKLGIRKKRIQMDTKKNTEIYRKVLENIGEGHLSPSNEFPNNVRYILDFDESKEYKVSREFLST